MAKKPRSQRRKKGSGNMGEHKDDAGVGADDGDVEVLSENHTVADTISTFGDEFRAFFLHEHIILMSLPHSLMSLLL